MKKAVKIAQSKEKIVNNRFRLQEKIAENVFSVVYRGVDLEHQKEVALKFLAPDICHQEHIVHYYLENAFFASQEIDQIAKVIDSGNASNGKFGKSYFIAMEFIHGVPLNRWYGEAKPPLKKCFDTFKKIADALDLLHHKKMIHGALKPINIFILGNKKPGVKITDVGLTRIKNFDAIAAEKKLIDVFKYMAPEQIGLIQRQVGAGTDLYSLGIFLYRLFYDKFPFKCDSLATLLHQQIARKPEPLSHFNSELPPALDAIVLKLLAKEPENRYHSAAGLSADFMRLLSGEKDFMPGEKDADDTLCLSARIIGRDLELREFKKTLSHVLDGKGACCLIAGEAGIGKSRLLEEYKQIAARHNIAVAAGNCRDRESRKPWGLFREALGNYLEELLWCHREKSDAITAAVCERCEDLAKIIINVCLSAARFFSNCPKLVTLAPEHAIQRACLAFTRFIFTLSRVEGGLVLLLDNLQWSDTASLKLLSEIARNISDQPLSVVGTYRHNEVDEGHELQRLLTTFRRKNRHGRACDSSANGCRQVKSVSPSRLSGRFLRIFFTIT